MLEWVKKAAVLFYLAILGASYMQLAWFFGAPSIGGLVLTPSAYPWIPPLSLVFTVPSTTCQGWSIRLQPISVFGAQLYLPIVHYFTNGYEVANYYPLTGSPIENIVNYINAIEHPQLVIRPYSGPCAARVIAVVPWYVVVAVMVIALSTKIYYKGRVW